MRMRVLSCGILCVALGAAAQQTYQASAGRTLIRAGHVIDVHTGNELADETVIVEGEKIVGVAKTADTPAKAGDRVVDLAQYTVMPGMIDVHTHLTMATNFDPYYELSMTTARRRSSAWRMRRRRWRRASRRCAMWARAGWTDVALRDEINAGHIPGPHMQVSGPPLGITGGHCDENLLPEQYHVQGDGVADGIAGVQHMVRQNIKYGADLIKIARRAACCRRAMIRRPRSTRWRRCRRLWRTRTGWAARWRRMRMERRAILWASEAGVDSIEHGRYMNDDDIAMMKKKGTYLVPTAYLDRLACASMGTCRRSTRRRWQTWARWRRRISRHAIESGSEGGAGDGCGGVSARPERA